MYEKCHFIMNSKKRREETKPLMEHQHYAVMEQIIINLICKSSERREEHIPESGRKNLHHRECAGRLNRRHLSG